MESKKNIELKLNNLYKELYPDRCLKDIQLDVISNLILGNDVLAILATGYGKSICYQLPFLYHKKCIIIVSPLIALMEDQHINLNKIGIPSVCFNSNMSSSDKEYNKDLLLENDSNCKILYMTPEYLIKEELFIKELNKLNRLCLIAIDEAHCISSWGHDFRKDYQQLGCLKEWIPNVPIFACTATATPKVQKEIVQYLQMTKPQIIKSSFDRTNLYIECNKKSGDIEADIFKILEEYKDDCIIIYAKTRDDTELICNVVKKLNITCEAYHAGITSKRRKEIHMDFVNKVYRCIVATIAFGMGIDQNVHLIIHYGLPSDMEAYTQEIGRAGRDGKDSKCILFWSYKDLHISRALLKDINNDRFREHKDKQIKLMERWVHSNICRKKIILEHFGEEMKNSCMKCDNCIKIELENKKKFDQSALFFPMFLIMKTMFVCNKRGLGAGKIIDIIRGSKSKAIIEFEQVETYGIGKKFNVELLKELIKVLTFNDYLKEVSLNQKFGSIIMTTEKTLNWWNDARKYKLENEMNYIKWQELNIPSSFEIIYNYLPKNNKLSNVLNRRTDFQKTLDILDLDENGISININDDLDLGIVEELVKPKKKLLVQTMTVKDIAEQKPKKTIIRRKIVKNETINDI